ncbi:MAG: hypothetical protein IT445_10085 [Phycisphaeraceae bacterium]|nr:hypothetical protein [Phycisphaeraceae bacterium]
MGAIKTDKLRVEFMHLAKQIDLPELTAPKTLRHLFATAMQDANIDPLIRNQLMGHSSMGRPTTELGMTSVYTHTRAETLRRQLTAALEGRPFMEVIRRRTTSLVAA